jgi:hypothetical protein
MLIMTEADNREPSAPPQLGDVDEMIAELREAGLDAWDEIEDPEAFIRELRDD